MENLQSKIFKNNSPPTKKVQHLLLCRIGLLNRSPGLKPSNLRKADSERYAVVYTHFYIWKFESRCLPRVRNANLGKKTALKSTNKTPQAIVRVQETQDKKLEVKLLFTNKFKIIERD